MVNGVCRDGELIVSNSDKFGVSRFFVGKPVRCWLRFLTEVSASELVADLLVLFTVLNNTVFHYLKGSSSKEGS